MVVLADEPVALQPTGECRLGDIAAEQLSIAPALRAVPRQLVAGVQFARPGRTSGTPGHLPHEMVGRGLERVSGLGVDAEDTLAAIRLRRHNARHPIGVVYLGADRVALTNSPIGISPAGVLTNEW